MTQTTTATRTLDPAPARPRSVLYGALIGVAALVVLLQGLWAGIFLEHDGARDTASGWIDLHARGADVAIVLGIAATVVRSSSCVRDVTCGSVARCSSSCSSSSRISVG